MTVLNARDRIWNLFGNMGNFGVAKKNSNSEKTVTVLTAADLHQSRELYQQLGIAVTKFRPDMVALVGDCLHADNDMTGRLSVEDCAAVLGSLPGPYVVFVRGNHEDENWSSFAGAWRRSNKPLVTLHGQTFKCGPLTVLGFPCLMGMEDYFITPREPLPYEADDWLKPLLRFHGAAIRTLWLMHEPPRGTPLSAPDTVVAGNQEWTDAIEYFGPRLVACGHDHITPIRNKRWHCKIGPTTCVNVGQTNHGPLHFTVIKARFQNEGSSQPVEIKVTAIPTDETVAV